MPSRRAGRKIPVRRHPFTQEKAVMFDIGPQELILILVLVLIIFGAGKLPEVGGALGKSLRSFKEGMKEEENRAGSQDPKSIEDKKDP
jgi:sec-independent protein translocase protein TatA